MEKHFLSTCNLLTFRRGDHRYPLPPPYSYPNYAYNGQGVPSQGELQPGLQFCPPQIQPAATHVQPIATNVQPTGTHIQTAGTHIQPAGTHVQPAATHIQTAATVIPMVPQYNPPQGDDDLYYPVYQPQQPYAAQQLDPQLHLQQRSHITPGLLQIQHDSTPQQLDYIRPVTQLTTSAQSVISTPRLDYIRPATQPSTSAQSVISTHRRQDFIRPRGLASVAGTRRIATARKRRFQQKEEDEAIPPAPLPPPIPQEITFMPGTHTATTTPVAPAAAAMDDDQISNISSSLGSLELEPPDFLGEQPMITDQLELDAKWQNVGQYRRRLDTYRDGLQQWANSLNAKMKAKQKILAEKEKHQKAESTAILTEKKKFDSEKNEMSKEMFTTGLDMLRQGQQAQQSRPKSKAKSFAVGKSEEDGDTC